MKALQLAMAPLVWLGALAVFLPVFLVGIPLTFVMALLGRYQKAATCYVWKDRWMKPWQTTDNGCLAFWYDRRFENRPRWFNVFVWSGLRNAAGNDLLTVGYDRQKVEWRGSSMEPLRAALKTDRFQWMVVQCGWFVGVWLVWPLKKKSVSDHFEARVGWKLLPSNEPLLSKARYTPWDIGRRIG